MGTKDVMKLASDKDQNPSTITRSKLGSNNDEKIGDPCVGKKRWIHRVLGPRTGHGCDMVHQCPTNIKRESVRGRGSCYRQLLTVASDGTRWEGVRNDIGTLRMHRNANLCDRRRDDDADV